MRFVNHSVKKEKKSIIFSFWFEQLIVKNDSNFFCLRNITFLIYTHIDFILPVYFCWQGKEGGEANSKARQAKFRLNRTFKLGKACSYSICHFLDHHSYSVLLALDLCGRTVPSKMDHFNQSDEFHQNHPGMNWTYGRVKWAIKQLTLSAESTLHIIV